MKLYDKMRLNMDPNDVNYQKVHIQFLDNFEENRFQDQIKVFNLESDKDKWNFIKTAEQLTIWFPQEIFNYVRTLICHRKHTKES